MTKNTRFKWRHRFLSAPVTQQPVQMSSIVEADETFFLDAFKGQRHLPGIVRKRGGKTAKRGTSAYKTIAQHTGIIPRPINVAAGQRVIGGIYPIQNVNAHDSRLKQWRVKFHGVATCHLESYWGWHRMIDHPGQHVTPVACFIAVIGKERRFQQVTAT